MIEKEEFIETVQEIVIPKMMAQQRTQKTPISNYIGLGIVFLILLSLFLLQLLFFFGAILFFVKNKSFTGGFAVILTALLAYVFVWVLIRVVKGMSNSYLSDKSIRVLNEEVLKALYFRKIKFNKPDETAFFNEIQFFDPPVKRKVDFDDDLSFSFDDGGINVYTGYFSSSKDRRNDMEMFLFEISTKNFYRTPVVFTLGDKESSTIDFGAIDNANEAFTVSGDARDVQYLQEKGICEKLLNIGNPEFNDDCVWCIHASFYHDKLYIAFDIEYSLSADLEDGYTKVQAYELFYDNVAAIEQYCRQFEDV